MVKIQKTSKLAKLSIAALLIGNSIVAAQHTGHAPVAAPVAEPTPAPVAEPAPAPVAEPVVTAPAPVAVAEPAPVAKPVESLSTTIAGTKISLYGRLELNSAYEDGITNGLWSAYAPKNSNKDAQGRTTLSVARSRFGFNLEGPSKEDEPTLKGRFEADFAAVGSGSSDFGNFRGSSGFRIRQSWGSVNFKDIGLTLLFGQTDDVVNPIDPPSINPSSLNGAGNIGTRRPQIRATQVVGPIDIAVAVMHDRIYNYTARMDKDKADPDRPASTDADGNEIPAHKGTDKPVSEGSNPPSIPAFQGRVGLKLPATWAGEKANLAFGVGGLYGKNEAANADAKNSYDSPEPAYMLGLDLSLPLIDILTLTGEFFSGQNLSRYEGSFSSYSRAYSDDGGIKSTGWWGGLSAKLPASVSAGAGIGAENLDKKSKIAGNIESNMFIFGNVAYNFTSAAKVTFEYLNLATNYTDKDGDTDKDKGHLNRFELNFRYDFK
ncbi:MAG: hypothetical protein FWF67_05095 [Fibromonadales bacterium]|nr:hypothetical protein [Fibromonadales bacterium]